MPWVAKDNDYPIANIKRHATLGSVPHQMSGQGCDDLNDVTSATGFNGYVSLPPEKSSLMNFQNAFIYLTPNRIIMIIIL